MNFFVKISIIAFCCILTACVHTEEETRNPVKKSATVCEMIRPKISTDNYRMVDPVTGKRKNIVDQAQSIQEYQNYSCSEVLDQAPLPTQTAP